MTVAAVQRVAMTKGAGWDSVGALFAACPDAFIQQSPAWAEIVAPLGPDDAFFLVAAIDGRPLAGLPLYCCDGVAGKVVTSVPQAGPLGGIFVHPDAKPDERESLYAGLCAAALTAATDLGATILTIITNPLDDDADRYRRHLAPDFEFENFTQTVGVADIVADGALSLSGPTATRIRHGGRHGLTVRRLAGDEFPRWYALHRRRHAELGAPPLPEALLSGLVRQLEPAGKAFVLGVETPDGGLIASGLYVLHQRVCDVFITAMDRDHARLHPNYLLTAEALLECARRGVETFNWQSSAARGNGVYQFKAKWRATERPYWFLTKALGPLDPFLALGKEGLGQAYPWHYVLPFGRFDAPDARRFRKP
ncbi:MAG: hypothetical protein FD176_1169 [Rhodospirillaceae bacterium]|nr:MAG: hypothetical protein FD176_1169 [Rhodospirillaceae bacterium]TNC96658.1 MAG: hypothetical protein FD119_1543 [Stygiobacter sp.]